PWLTLPGRSHEGLDRVRCSVAERSADPRKGETEMMHELTMGETELVAGGDGDPGNLDVRVRGQLSGPIRMLGGEGESEIGGKMRDFRALGAPGGPVDFNPTRLRASPDGGGVVSGRASDGGFRAIVVSPR